MQIDTSDKSTARKRGTPYVTKNACVACRKKRARCDGNIPCGRCVTQDEKCHYEVSTRVSKDAMREQIEMLKAYKDASQRVLGALAGEDGEGDVMTGIVIDALRSGEGVDEISRYLNNEETESVSGSREWKRVERGEKRAPGSWGNSPATATTTTGSGGSHTPTTSLRASSVDAYYSPPVTAAISTARQSSSCSLSSTAPTPNPTTTTTSSSKRIPSLSYEVTQWTTVTSDLALIKELMAFYFCWEYPIFASISKTEFLPDYLSGRRRYCSSLLVNAMLAVGHRYLAASTSTSPEAGIETDPMVHGETGPEMGEAFQAEAERLLAEENGRSSLLTVQALGMLSIREASLGRNSTSSSYSCESIKMAVQMGLHRACLEGTSRSESDVRAATFWGAFALDQFWSLNIGRMPHISRNSISIEKPRVVAGEERDTWRAYNNVMSPLTEEQQPANVRSVSKAFVGLTEIIHDSQHLVYESRDGALNQEMLAVYRRYLDWYADLPAVLRLGRNSTPSVLFAHIYYHFSLIMFFRPFLKLGFHNSHVVPRDICSEAASAISLLVRSYGKMHSLRRTPCLFPYMVFAASCIHLICVTDSPYSESNEFDMAFSALLHGDQDLLTDMAEKTDVGGLTRQADAGQPTRWVQGGPRASEQVVQDIADLNEMTACHAFANRARHMLVRMAQNWGIAPAADLQLSPRTPGGGGVGGGKGEDDATSLKKNIINWKKVMEREGVFDATEGEEDRDRESEGESEGEGLLRSDTLNFFCLDGEKGRQVKGLDEGWAAELGIEIATETGNGSEHETGVGVGVEGEREEQLLLNPFLAVNVPLSGAREEKEGEG